MRKLTSIRSGRSSTTKLQLHAEVIRELNRVELRDAPVGGCRTGSGVSGKPPYELARADLPNMNPTCPML